MVNRSIAFAALSVLSVAAITAVVAPSAASAQVVTASGPGVTTHLAVGVAYPSGGDLNDTYAAGPFVATGASMGVATFAALRIDADYSEFAPSKAPKHSERDSRMGKAGTGNIGVDLYAPGDSHSRAWPTLIAEAGASDVGATWLNAHNVVEPFSQSRLFDFAFGARWAITGRMGFEVRRFTAHRGDRGTVGYIPATLDFTF